MATTTKTSGPLAGIRKRDLHRALNEDPRVRDWLSEALMTPLEVSEYLGIERARLWRWEQAGGTRRPIRRVAETVATPLYLRSDVEKLKAIIDADPSSRRRRRTAEPEPEPA